MILAWEYYTTIVRRGYPVAKSGCRVKRDLVRKKYNKIIILDTYNTTVDRLRESTDWFGALFSGWQGSLTLSEDEFGAWRARCGLVTGFVDWREDEFSG